MRSKAFWGLLLYFSSQPRSKKAFYSIHYPGLLPVFFSLFSLLCNLEGKNCTLLLHIIASICFFLLLVSHLLCHFFIHCYSPCILLCCKRWFFWGSVFLHCSVFSGVVAFVAGIYRDLCSCWHLWQCASPVQAGGSSVVQVLLNKLQVKNRRWKRCIFPLIVCLVSALVVSCKTFNFGTVKRLTNFVRCCTWKNREAELKGSSVFGCNSQGFDCHAQACCHFVINYIAREDRGWVFFLQGKPLRQ